MIQIMWIPGKFKGKQKRI